MELALTPDQKTFRTTARDFLAGEYPLDRIRALDPLTSGPDRDWWTRAAELGWTALLVPEELGGGSVSDDGVRDLALLAEELGAGVAPGPLLATNTVLAGLVAARTDGTGHDEAIEALAGGGVATWAVAEPGTGWDPEHPALQAVPDADGFRLTGVKDRVEAVEWADRLLVTAATPDGVAQFLVPADAPGITTARQWSLDLGRTFSEVRFDGVRVDAAQQVGRTGDTAVIERQVQVALLIQCAEICGGLQRMFEATRQWADDRYSFGRPLASYQALKHRFADLRTWLEGCHAATSAAARAVQSGSADAGRLVRVAKVFVGDYALQILQDCVQLHGGIGVTWEHDLHLYLRRATVDRSLHGTPSEHSLTLADLALAGRERR